MQDTFVRARTRPKGCTKQSQGQARVRRQGIHCMQDTFARATHSA